MASLIKQARNDADAAETLVEALIAMRAPGDEADEARVVLQHLDAKSLDGLIDAKGRRAKHGAVETLLSLGFSACAQREPRGPRRVPQVEAGEELRAQRMTNGARTVWLLRAAFAGGGSVDFVDASRR